MIRQLMALATPLNLEIVGLVFFVALFGVLVLWTFRRGSTRRYQDLANLPLESEALDVD